jgi:hypothetical protein
MSRSPVQWAGRAITAGASPPLPRSTGLDWTGVRANQPAVAQTSGDILGKSSPLSTNQELAPWAHAFTRHSCTNYQSKKNGGPHLI